MLVVRPGRRGDENVATETDCAGSPWPPVQHHSLACVVVTIRILNVATGFQFGPEIPTPFLPWPSLLFTGGLVVQRCGLFVLSQ